MNKEKTKVLFLVEADGTTLAVFPERLGRHGCVVCFTHQEQHSTAAIDYYKKLPQQVPGKYAPLAQELKGRNYDLEILNKDEFEPIKCAITSHRDGLIYIVYKDGGVKIIDQGADHSTIAAVVNIEPEEIATDLVKYTEPEDLEILNEALKPGK